MTKIILHIFAVRHSLISRVNQLDFNYNYIGVVSLDSFCSAIGGCRNLEGATLYSLFKVNYFSHATPEKQFTTDTQGVLCCNVCFTKRAINHYFTRVIYNLQQQTINNNNYQALLLYAFQNRSWQILLRSWQKLTRSFQLFNIENEHTRKVLSRTRRYGISANTISKKILFTQNTQTKKYQIQFKNQNCFSIS